MSERVDNDQPIPWQRPKSAEFPNNPTFGAGTTTVACGGGGSSRSASVTGTVVSSFMSHSSPCVLLMICGFLARCGGEVSADVADAGRDALADAAEASAPCRDRSPTKICGDPACKATIVSKCFGPSTTDQCNCAAAADVVICDRASPICPSGTTCIRLEFGACESSVCNGGGGQFLEPDGGLPPLGNVDGVCWPNGAGDF